MARKCEGCRVEVLVDWRTGDVTAGDGSSRTAIFNDRVLVVWECPACGYPHAERVTSGIATGTTAWGRGGTVT